MKTTSKASVFLFLVLIGHLFSCGVQSGTELETLPYFDLKGFIELKLNEIDSVRVIKVTRVQDKEKKLETVYTREELKNEFEVFKEADINKRSLIKAYDTKVSNDQLIHELFPKAEGKVKFMKISYFEDEVSSISIKQVEKNLFYSSITLANIYINNATHKIDHYDIETTQKIWFLKPNNMKISGVLKD